MIKLILNLLEKIPYRTRFGLSISDELKVIYYWKFGQYKRPQRCLCGGIVVVHTYCYGENEIGWSTECDDCSMLYDED